MRSASDSAVVGCDGGSIVILPILSAIATAVADCCGGSFGSVIVILPTLSAIVATVAGLVFCANCASVRLSYSTTILLILSLIP